jgi:type I restriction enzyme S subunit
MSFPRYPSYKDSGVEWLGKVPGHWGVRRIGYYFNERREKVSDKDFPALSVTKNGIVPQLDTAAKSDDGDNRKKVCNGDFVINSRSDRKGSGGVSELDGSVSLICTVLHPQEHVHTPFVNHLLRCQPFQEEFYRNGKGIVADLWSTNFSEMRNILLGMPPLTEQNRIADFLDRETAKIDELVAEQRRLMELLKEKRQAVISHAVTQGLNPHAPMKPSGIEWLGDVPVHWEVMSLKRDLDFLTSGSRGWAENYSDEGELFIRITNLTRGSIGLDLTDIQRVAVPDGAEGSRTKVRPGDVLFSITAYLGSVAVVPDVFESAYVSQHVALARLRQVRLMPKWVGFVALSLVGQTWFETKSYGGTKIQLSLDDVRDLPIPVPPLDEQCAIVALLETQVTQFDTLTAEAQRAIDLLQERRTALISAAVTGQIDVRALAGRKAA